MRHTSVPGAAPAPTCKMAMSATLRSASGWLMAAGIQGPLQLGDAPRPPRSPPPPCAPPCPRRCRCARRWSLWQSAARLARTFERCAVGGPLGRFFLGHVVLLVNEGAVAGVSALRVALLHYGGVASRGRYLRVTIE
eukprot:scaffold133_cov257-Pinguiococcus_pyrenoidosus.AAC.24